MWGLETPGTGPHSWGCVSWKVSARIRVAASIPDVGHVIYGVNYANSSIHVLNGISTRTPITGAIRRPGRRSPPCIAGLVCRPRERQAIARRCGDITAPRSRRWHGVQAHSTECRHTARSAGKGVNPRRQPIAGSRLPASGERHRGRVDDPRRAGIACRDSRRTARLTSRRRRPGDRNGSIAPLAVTGGTRRVHFPADRGKTGPASPAMQ